MRPHALSLEPVLILSCAVAIVCIVVLAVIVWKCNRVARTLAVVASFMACFLYCLWLGEAVGRSKAWYHWEWQYHGPLQTLQRDINRAMTNGNTQVFDYFTSEYIKQDIQAYGREPLFQESAFNAFIQRVDAVSQTNAP